VPHSSGPSARCHRFTPSTPADSSSSLNRSPSSTSIPPANCRPSTSGAGSSTMSSPTSTPTGFGPGLRDTHVISTLGKGRYSVRVLLRVIVRILRGGMVPAQARSELDQIVGTNNTMAAACCGGGRTQAGSPTARRTAAPDRSRRQLVRRCASRPERECRDLEFPPVGRPTSRMRWAVDVTADCGLHPLLFCIQLLEMPRPFRSSSTASLRCEIAFFCLLDISANVRSLPAGTKMES